MGMAAFAKRARRELAATGEVVPGAQRRDHHYADRAGGSDRPAGLRRPHQSGDRRAAVPQRAHGRMAPAQGLHPSPASAPAGSWTPRWPGPDAALSPPSNRQVRLPGTGRGHGQGYPRDITGVLRGLARKAEDMPLVKRRSR
jgi:hypothetical protein